MQVKEEKALLRARYKALRAGVAGKAEKSAAACEKLLESNIYRAAEQVLCYFPIQAEMDTHKIIESALSANKKVALPVCTDRAGNMEFYYIDRLAGLKAGVFGIAEPDAAVCRRAVDFRHALIIVPALSFDVYGFRLGYGGGYYDKFLKKFINRTSYSVGMCYNELISSALPQETHDSWVGYICTENSFQKAKHNRAASR